ncbi:hypothetical protein GCM10007103_23680 [Salinimicrobium marinum]|uniref:Uncharacterized protein n=2 Tax=Salinimicrobium marinum TaxID=680283 RepID=A0A918SGP7_9FLAO|nr:hypothetical protein GCM10007103_23680 [Salinimicrobium marinum]
MLEELSEEGPELKIRSETVEQQPCMNYGLVTEFNYAPEGLKINYPGIYIPEVCLTAIGPATSERIFPYENGTYEIEFVNEGVSNKGKLIVDDEKYFMELFSPVNVFVENETLFKIPENTYWGIIGYHEESSAALAQKFTDELKAENAVFEQHKDGHYGYFEIANGAMQLPELHGYWFAEPVIFRFDGELEQLKSIVADFAARHGEEVNVSLNSAKGEEIHSYSL